MKISIIIPTYNERENIGKIVKNILDVCRKLNIEIIIVDDNSPDGTGKIADKLSKKYPKKVFVIHRKAKSNLSPAVIDGFKVAKGSYIGVMDADLSHPPELIPKFIQYLDKGFDMLIGSRHIKGGGIEDWTVPRRIVSFFATMLCRPLADIKDPMSGYFFIKRSVINNAKLVPRGYKIGLEIAVKGNVTRIKEIPFFFKNRVHGKSKLYFKVYMAFLRQLLDLYWYKLGKMIKG